jgi:predicted heme/steroid binding protein
MQKSTKISVIVAGGVISAAVFIRMQSRQTPAASQNVSVSMAQLKEANGKVGKKCWLAVDGIVYEVDQGYKWIDGEHVEASIAYCGADMSDVIDKAPHGRTKLTQLTKVGKLE